MSQPQFDFYFEKAGRSSAQGAIAPAEQFFEGSIAEVSLAREIGQNSLDASAGDGPVLIRFELSDMTTHDVPGIATLRTHLEYVANETSGSEGNARMVAARDASLQPTISVLRISDYGTTGLRGSESRDFNTSALSALTRGAGISANDESRGGSFGIGSAVGPMSSTLCTVLYTSLPDDAHDVVFAGYSRLASHRDGDGTWRQAEGFFTDLEDKDFSYIRNPDPIGPFTPRTEPGTDIYVMGYRKAGDDPKLDHIRDAFISHFLVAIHRGRLEVEGVSGATSWRLDSTTLAGYVKDNPDAAAFYLAIHDEQPFEKVSKRFGKLSLYVNVDDSLPRTLHTITMRSPLMKIDTFRHTSIPVTYAAVLECSDGLGNKLLRALEPPQHDKWDQGRADGGAAALRELRNFVRDGLKERVEHRLGDIVEIKGLSKYLPGRDIKIAKDGHGQAPASGEDATGEETATVHGKPAEAETALVTPRKGISVPVRTSTSTEGGDPVEKGKDRGGDKKRKPSRPGIPGTGGEGEGKARIARGEVKFRSWTEEGTSDLYVTLSSADEITGELELVPIGFGGAAEDDYALPILSAELLEGGTELPVQWAGNILSDIPLKAGQTTRLRLRLDQGHRYRLDIK